VLKLRELIEFLQGLEAKSPGVDFYFEILGGPVPLDCVALPEAVWKPDPEGGHWYLLRLHAEPGK
jgi:hypothetical protein